MRYLGIVATMAVCLVVAGPAAAVTVTYTVAGWGPNSFPGPIPPPSTASHVLDGLGYPGDSVELETYSATVDLPLGVSVQKINTVLWDVNYTYAGAGDPLNPDAGWQQLWFNINAPRIMTIGTQTKDLTQAGLLEVLWANDYLSFSEGSTTTFYVDTYRVDVTPLAVARAEAEFSPGPPWHQPARDVMAQFNVTAGVGGAIPEPVTMAGLFLGLAGLGGYIRKRRKA